MFSQSIRIIVPLLAAVAIPSTACFAWGGEPCGYLIDDNTRYAWARTWHGPNALATPLTQYFIPRMSGKCNGDGYAAGCGCQAGVAGVGAGQYGAGPYPADAAAGFEPMQFERLGKVPNEMDLGGSLPLPAGAPAPAPRR
jgi:hypothetical protein